MPDLHGWITQQIDETEKRARACTASDWRHVGHGTIVDRDTDGWQGAPDNAVIARIDVDRIYYSCSPPYVPDADHVALNSPDHVLRRCAAARRVLARHRLNPDAYWAEAAMCDGCGTEGEMDYPRTENLNDCPELLDLAHAYGITPEILAGLDRPQEGERPDPVCFLISATTLMQMSEVPPSLRGPNWKGQQ
ncbi:DUF6221 family protein [Streptomyces ossamyceticus]|uniref:DUF6221 family protein n=1 Tax=Streptomyces ossamyceticus TaxID=249581 RepID=UPI00342C7040